MIRILVVDDDPKLNQAACTYLNDCGYEAKGCLSAEAAYDAMYSQLFDLIISDIMMPGTDGFEFAETIRGLNKTIPILFMSARDDLPAKQKGFDLGIDDYMVKPIDFSELLMRVRALLRRANIEASRRLTVGGLVLNADALTASVDAVREVLRNAGINAAVSWQNGVCVITPADPRDKPAIEALLAVNAGDLPWRFAEAAP